MEDEKFKTVYNYVDGSGIQRQIEINEFKDSLEIDKIRAQNNIISTQAHHNTSLSLQINVQTFTFILSEIRQALGSIGVDDEKEQEKSNGGLVSIKSAFEEPGERARLKKLYGRTLDAAVRYVCQLDPEAPRDNNNLMFDDEI